MIYKCVGIFTGMMDMLICTEIQTFYLQTKTDRLSLR